MRQLMVRYKVKPELAQENERLVRAVYDELEHSAPAGLRYATFKLEDGVSFVHLASIETDDGHNPLREVDVFATEPMPFEQLYARATVRRVSGVDVRVASVADLIVMKSAAGRPQDLEDIEALRRLGP